MIAPARRAAIDALAVIDAGDLDMGSAIARERAGLTDERDRALLLEVVTGTLRMQAAPRLPAGRAREAAAGQAGCRRASRAADERVPVDLPVAAAGVGDHQRCGRADAAIRKIERRRSRPTPCCGPCRGIETSLSWPSRDEHRSSISSIVHSHPRWLVDRWLASLRRAVDRSLARIQQRAGGDVPGRESPPHHARSSRAGACRGRRRDRADRHAPHTACA